MPPRLLGLMAALLLACLSLGQSSRLKEPARSLPFTPPRKWALVIGANDYTELGKLTYAASDAKAFAKVLQERFGFQSAAIETITDAPDSKSRPTSETITAALDRQIGDPRLNDGDLFIFYFSGHGIGTPKGDFLMPTNALKSNADTVGLDVKDLIQRFVKAGLRNVLFIVDACRGGEKNNFGSDLRKLGKEANIAVILGCEPGTRSYEYPQLGHGVFTSFLLKALKSKDLESPTTGALWTSNIAADVQQKVREYTVRDYPTQPQSPTGWTEKTMDVMLGAFPTKAEARLKLNDIVAESERLDPDSYVSGLRRYIDVFEESGRTNDVIELFRSIDALKKLQPNDRIQFALALSEMGRTLEMENQFAILEKQEDSEFYSTMAKLMNPSRKIGPEDRVKLAWKVWDKGRNSWAAFTVWGCLQVYASKADANRFLEEALKLDSLEERASLFFKGQLAANHGKWTEAESLWNQGIAKEGDEPKNSVFKGFLFQAFAFIGKTNRLPEFIQQAVKDDASSAAMWHLVLAQYYQEQGKADAAMDSIKRALDSNPEPDQLLWALRVAGLRFPLISEKVAKAADRYPFAWKAMLAKIWATKLREKPTGIAEALDEAAQFCDDEFGVLLECFRLLDGMFDEALHMGKMTPDAYMEFMVAYSTVLAQNVDQLGYDSFAWLLLSKFGLMAEKYEQLIALYDLKLGRELDRGTLDPTLQPSYLFAALSIGNDRRIGQLSKTASYYPADEADSALALSIYHAMKGNLVLANQSLPKVKPSKVFTSLSKAYEAYLSTVQGKTVQLAPLLKTSKDSPAAMQLLALAFASKKEWSKADPLLAEYAFQRQLAYTFVQARCVETYFSRLIATKQFEKANEVAHTVAITSYGNPLYAKIHFGKEPKLASFEGSIELEAAEFEQLPEMVRGKMDLRIDSKGNVAGKATMAGKDRSISGSVDALGNLKATMKDGDKVWAMTGKMAQPPLYRSLPVFKRNVQAFLLLDDKGQARYLMGRAK
jgi:tetratricopeptide (TPR) repeat protein